MMNHSSTHRRPAFTLIEMLVVIGIILALAALAAAFMPRVNDSNNLSRAVDSFEQWLLTAKMRAKRDGLATGIRFVPVQGDAPGQVSTFQYIQQPEPLTGGDGVVTFGKLVSVAAGVVTFASVDLTLGGGGALVLPGDYLSVDDRGVSPIDAAASGTTLKLSDVPVLVPGSNPPVWKMGPPPLTITQPTTNYRIIRQPRILIGEEPLVLPRNYAAHFGPIPGSNSGIAGTTVQQSPNGYWEILFSPAGAVVGGSAGRGYIFISLWDSTMTDADINRVGVVGVRTSTGFIGAYQASPGADPFYWAKTARESGM